MLANHTREA